MLVGQLAGEKLSALLVTTGLAGLSLLAARQDDLGRLRTYAALGRQLADKKLGAVLKY